MILCIWRWTDVNARRGRTILPWCILAILSLACRHDGSIMWNPLISSWIALGVKIWVNNLVVYLHTSVLIKERQAQNRSHSSSLPSLEASHSQALRPPKALPGHGGTHVNLTSPCPVLKKRRSSWKLPRWCHSSSSPRCRNGDHGRHDSLANHIDLLCTELGFEGIWRRLHRPRVLAASCISAAQPDC